MKRTFAICAVGLLAYLSTGLYFVQPDEQVVVRRFGRMLPQARAPGPHFGLPWGLDRIDRVKAREVKLVTIGPVRLGGEAVGIGASQFLTGDRNLINVRATIHYSIRPPLGNYLFHTARVDPVVAAAGEAAMTSVLAGQPVDRALTLGKEQLGSLVRQRLQRSVDRYDLGILIRSVDVGTVEPPAEVAEAFAKVISALRQREQQINEAQSYANRTLAEAQARAQQIRNQARADRERRVREAEGEAQRFEKLLAEYLRSPELTASRLYLETMAETFPKFRSKLIIDSSSEIDLSILRGEKQ